MKCTCTISSLNVLVNNLDPVQNATKSTMSMTRACPVHYLAPFLDLWSCSQVKMKCLGSSVVSTCDCSCMGKLKDLTCSSN